MRRPGMGTCQTFSGNRKEVRAARVQWARGQVLGAEAERLTGPCNDFASTQGETGSYWMAVSRGMTSSNLYFQRITLANILRGLKGNSREAMAPFSRSWGLGTGRSWRSVATVRCAAHLLFGHERLISPAAGRAPADGLWLAALFKDCLL